MSAALVIRKAGICSTVQDLGREGYRAYGVPRSGALDPVALTLVNILVGNLASAPAIEMLYGGIALEAHARVRVAVSGTGATISRAGDDRTRRIPPWESTLLQAGETLRVDTVRDTAAAYLAVEGGLDVPPVLGSAATYLRATLGGWHGRTLAAGDALPLKLSQPTMRAERRYSSAPALCAPDRLRVMLGPHADRFESASLQTLLTREYAVTTSSDRAGLRLEGPPLDHVGGYDARSEGVATGSIQVPGTGLPVILIGDHPTVGGYPKVATIISADLAAAGRLRIGSRIRFAAVDADAARAAREQLKRDLDAMISGIAYVDDASA
jgi:biotin-dependent carboxylase-like uncharacterized protein